MKTSFLFLLCLLAGIAYPLSGHSEEKPKPKIINIVNFIRLLEPRDPKITEDVLYQTVFKQVEMIKEYHLGSTFLLQYDALMDSRYQKLLKNLLKDAFEIGAWWEIPQPMVEKAGLKSVGSWFIDSHTLNYLYEKYHIIASSNCKDQVGNDGYTLWGGYWNQAYYPGKINSYMPAQNEIAGSNRKTVWFNSRFYRVNLLWENGSLNFRDIHLFNEDFPSVYTKGKATSNECSFFTLPFVDGYVWSKPGTIAGMRFKALENGKEVLLEGGDPVIESPSTGKLHIVWPLKDKNVSLIMDIDERQMTLRIKGAKPINWFLDMTAAENAVLPFKAINANKIDCQFEGMDYSITAIKGTFNKPDDKTVFRIKPSKNTVQVDFSGKK